MVKTARRVGATPVAVLRLFAAARDAAGTGRDLVSGDTVGAVLDQARARYGEVFTAVLTGSRVWKNGEPATPETPVDEGDEIAVLPPVSGGAR
jgi:molybdopterin converting factor small subunit